MARFITFFLIFIAGLVWLTSVHPVFATAGNPTASTAATSLSLTSLPLISFPLQPLTAGAIESETNTEPPFSGDGVVFIDTSSGAPGVPYIVYEAPQGGFGMKSLIFNANEPCQVSAGELPCVRDINENDPSESDVSPIPSGTAIHLEGEVDDQAVVVENYSQISTVPAGMHFISVPFGTTATLSDGVTTITPNSVMDDASCTLGIGCFAEGVDRLSVSISSGDSTNNTEIIPGTIFMYNKSAIILLSITGSGDQSAANFLVIDK